MALATVGGLDWPYDGDHFRDIAQAQTALQGHPLADPFYAGEWVWYNPLVPWLVALGAWLSGAPSPLVHVQSGPWLNLLGPVAFYLLGVRLAGRLAAFISLALLLFVNCDTAPSLTCATYSPWLFVASFAQGLFFFGVLALDRAARSGSRQTAAAAGAVAGLTFLAHTGPALILGGIALLTLPRRSLVIAGAAALAVASPFVWAIAVHYRLHVLNATPMAWSWPPLTVSGFPVTLRENAVVLMAAAGGLFVIRHRVMYAWMGVAALLLALALSRDIVPSLPALVPTFHFWRYVLAGATLLAGALAATAIERVVRGYALAIVPVVLIAAVVALPHYRNRFDFLYGRGVAAGRSSDLSKTATFLRKSTPPDAVVLGSRGRAQGGRCHGQLVQSLRRCRTANRCARAAAATGGGSRYRPVQCTRGRVACHACGRHGTGGMRGHGRRRIAAAVPVWRGVCVRARQQGRAVRSQPWITSSSRGGPSLHG